MDGEEYKNLAPMNIYEAIEAIKIIAYYTPAIEEAKAESLLDIITIITNKADEWGTGISLFRLVALMYHKDVMDLFAELKDQSGEQFTALLQVGLQVNDVHLLLSSATILGLK